MMNRDASARPWAPKLGALAIGALVSVTLLPSTASAQMPSFGGAPTGPVVGGSGQTDAPKQSAPPALPGARAQKTEPAPPTAASADLPPTEALFDAINRGDTLAARDAVNRGAEIGGHNVLGLTPLDLSIDLGRNEITFLLLSLRSTSPESGPPQKIAAAPPGRRGGKSPAPAPAIAATSAPEGGPSAPSRAQLAAADKAAAKAERERLAEERKAAKLAAAQSSNPVAPRPVATLQQTKSTQPRQYAGPRDESGTPIPQMGFLGFGSVTR
jgi:hypothetical protein